MAAVLCGTSHSSAVSRDHFGGYLYLKKKERKKRAIKAIHSRRITCEGSESARERRISLYKSDQKHVTRTR